MIELEHISKIYEMGDQELHALDDVSEHVDAGEYIAVMGPSGSGKSTLLNVLGCLDRPSLGSYRLDGEDVSQLLDDELSRIRQHKIGFVFQSFHLVARLTAAENVAFPMVFAGLPRAERMKRVAAALDAVGLSERANHRPSELSGGERQRVAVARATILKPRILLADEPTGNLDSKSGKQVLDLIERLNTEGLTLLVVTHDPIVAARANRVLLMRDGKIVRRVAGSELAQSGIGSFLEAR